MNRPKSYARLQKEAEEGNERLPENHGYGGSKVSTRPAKRARVQVEEHEDEALRKEDEKSLHAMGLDANKLREIRSQYGSEERGGAERSLSLYVSVSDTARRAGGRSQVGQGSKIGPPWTQRVT